MLEAIGIKKAFLQRGIVLDNLNLSVKEGDSISVMGPSGSGKTTLLNILGLLDKPDSGDIIFRGRSLLGYTSDESAQYRNKNIGFIFQDHLLLPYLTIRENILLPLLASNLSDMDFKERTKKADSLMEKTGIQDIAKKYPFQVSGGEAQRATLVRSLVNNPSLILADEPTGSLDKMNSGMLADLLVEINNESGVTLIVATHSNELSAKMKYQFELVNGRLAATH
ncbi:MAG: ABC transporter ATP-binding protein [Bacteroidales bacterium]|jgi:ABC-type lipoprotein export system ATPase subunit|nr:ABC transporter ATP-binding protein [Bacteroidales bacterium]